MAALRFACTPGGAVLKDRRRLRSLLLGLGTLMLVTAAGAWLAGRVVPGCIALLVGLAPAAAWLMNRQVDMLWLELEGGTLAAQLRSGRERLPLAGARARRLDPDEIAHLESLATMGGGVAGSWGIDSHRLGELHVFATDFSRAVLVEVAEAPEGGEPDEPAVETRWVVTPDDPEGFLAALRTTGC